MLTSVPGNSSVAEPEGLEFKLLSVSPAAEEHSYPDGKRFNEAKICPLQNKAVFLVV